MSPAFSGVWSSQRAVFALDVECFKLLSVFCLLLVFRFCLASAPVIEGDHAGCTSLEATSPSLSRDVSVRLVGVDALCSTSLSRVESSRVDQVPPFTSNLLVLLSMDLASLKVFEFGFA